jgi:hypothetical protein
VTIDGIRPSEVFQGVDPVLAKEAGIPRDEIVDARRLLPNINRLFFQDGAVLGDPALPGGIAASGPRFVSLPGYFEIMTGTTSECRTNDCNFVLGRTIAEDIAKTSPSAPSGVFASWEAISRVVTANPPRGLITISAGRERGSDVAPHPGHGDYRPDAITWPRAIAYLQEQRPRFLWISLGDADEWAHGGNYRGYLGALTAADTYLGELAGHLEAMGERGERTMVIVTTDHGRDGFIHHGGAESGPVWLLARGAAIAKVGSIGTSQTRHLGDIAPTIRAVFGVQERSFQGSGQVIEEILRRDLDAPEPAPSVAERRSPLARRDRARATRGL